MTVTVIVLENCLHKHDQIEELENWEIANGEPTVAAETWAQVDEHETCYHTDD